MNLLSALQTVPSTRDNQLNYQTNFSKIFGKYSKSPITIGRTTKLILNYSPNIPDRRAQIYTRFTIPQTFFKYFSVKKLSD